MFVPWSGDLASLTCKLHKEFLMVLHHAVMVLVCFPLSVVSGVCGN